MHDILPQEWLRLFISWDRRPLTGAKELLADLQLPPSTVLYLDDNQEIVEAARALGIRGFQARGIDQARPVLKSERCTSTSFPFYER
jgi:hypothetical protein